MRDISFPTSILVSMNCMMNFGKGKTMSRETILLLKPVKLHILVVCEAPGVKGGGGIAQSSSSATDASLLQRKQSFFITNMHLLISVSEDAAAALDMASQAYKRRKGEFTSHIKKCVLTTNMMRLQLFQAVLHSHESY